MLENYKTNFEYHAPYDVKETLGLLSQYGNDCRLIAGGTDLIPKIKAGIVKFDHLISLKNNAELRTMSFDLNEGLTIGACVTLIDTEKSGAVRKYYPALYTGIHSMANTQIRNRGTVTGNICNAVPSADAAPALIVYGAKVKLMSAKAERIVPIEDFFTGVCTTVIEPDELAAAIILPAPKAGSFSVYYKYTIRKALELAMIGIAVNVLLNGKKVVTDAKISLGAVAATPKRAWNAEKRIMGNKLTDDLILDAARIASQEDCAPISDIRATADYRREMVRVHVRDALRKAADEK